MIRLGTVEDLPTILTIVEEAKSIMQQENNNQWDEQYPLKSQSDHKNVQMISTELCLGNNYAVVKSKK